MIDLCPRFILKKIPMKNKKYFAYLFTAVVVAILGWFYNTGYWRQVSILDSGYSLFMTIRNFIKFGVRCPLCGGTRSFRFIFSGDIIKALHHSIIGTVVFVFVYLLIPFRLLILFNIKNRLTYVIKVVDEYFEKYFIYIIFVLYALQLLLDDLGVFVWEA